MVKDWWLIVDIDGVLADWRWRLARLDQGWEAVRQGMEDDPPITEMVMLLSALQGLTNFVFLSGRPECYRSQTEAWLLKHTCYSPRDDLLILKPDADDRQPNSLFKAEQIQRLQEHGYQILAIIDDHPENLTEAERLGLSTLLFRHQP